MLHSINSLIYYLSMLVQNLPDFSVILQRFLCHAPKSMYLSNSTAHVLNLGTLSYHPNPQSVCTIMTIIMCINFRCNWKAEPLIPLAPPSPPHSHSLLLYKLMSPPTRHVYAMRPFWVRPTINRSARDQCECVSAALTTITCHITFGMHNFAVTTQPNPPPRRPPWRLLFRCQCELIAGNSPHLAPQQTDLYSEYSYLRPKK